ncbi:MAG: class I SAM-dependent methyltransferase [Bacteroidetes bacterium]|nr:class I SAM-dependent methyltransferase [Bacteroidota bacterium]
MSFIKSLYRFISPRFQNIFLEYKVDFGPRYTESTAPHRLLNELINRNRNEYARLLQASLKYFDVFHSLNKMSEEQNAQLPVYNNNFLPGLDIVMLYTILSEYKPATYVEVGSGNSTKVAYHAIKKQGLSTKIISMDPYPRAEIDALSNKIIREPFEKSNFDFLFALKPNDILFIDNSHRILPNSDAMVFFMEVLPLLPKGVLVQVHDVYLPFDYPQDMCNRAYNEQYGLAFFLMANPERYHTIMPNYFVYTDKELHAITAPIWNNPKLHNVEQHGGSYWVVIK